MGWIATEAAPCACVPDAVQCETKWSGAPLIRDRSRLGVRNGPGSAAHHCAVPSCCAAPGTREMNARRFYSITSSAVASNACGTWRPSILAVEALMTSSNLLGCSTGKSAGFAPLRMRPV
jgi:hypothetical protein